MIRGCRPALLALVVLACGRGEAEEAAPSTTTRDAAPAPEDPWRAIDAAPATGEACERLPFAHDLPIAEASGAARLEVDGRAVVLVVGDSGTHGAYLLVDASTGEVVEQGRLPLGDGAGDDLEGLAAADGLIWGVTSAGWMRAWRRTLDHFALVDGPYPIGAAGLTCGADDVNCGNNYEGLCVADGAAPGGGCAGVAVSKADGRMYCLVRDGARLVGDGRRSAPMASPHVLSGCDLGPDQQVAWLGSNGFDGGNVYQVRGWRDPATAQVTRRGPLGEGFPEAIVVGPDDVVYRFSDTSVAPSLAGRYRCR